MTLPQQTLSELKRIQSATACTGPGHPSEVTERQPSNVITSQQEQKFVFRVTRQAERPMSTTSTSASIPTLPPYSVSPKSFWDSHVVPVKMSLVELYMILQADSSSTRSRVISVTCYKGRQGVRHEYLVLQVHSPQFAPRWIRLERAAMQTDLGGTGFRHRLQSSTSAFVPDDTAIIASSPDLTFEDARVMEHIVFPSRQQPSLLTLSKLLEAFCEESTVYTLPAENCWFFCSVVIENLAKHSGSNVKARNRALGRDTRKRIANSFERLLA